MIHIAGSKKLILLVDDDRLIHTIVGGFLRAEGFEVHSAYDWRDAVRKLARFPPDLIILDLMMPEINGYVIAETLQREIGYEVPILVYSGFKPEESTLRNIQAVSQAYLAKPSPLADILATVQRLLLERQSAKPGA